ncbi:MAG: hypothetical protein AAF826_10715 [Pseudomonadota bacterium]
MTDLSDPNFDVAKHVDCILHPMPKQFHASRGVVELRRHLLDDCLAAELSETDTNQRFDRLEREIAKRFGVQMPPLTPVIEKPKAKTLSEMEILADLEFIVGDEFSTTIDDSSERAEYLRQLAEKRCEEALAAKGIGWFKKSRLRKAVTQIIEREKQAVRF